MAQVEPPTPTDLLAPLLMMVTEHLVEDLVEEPPLPAETTELLVEAAVVALVEEEEAVPLAPVVPTELLEVDLKADSEAALPLLEVHTVLQEVGLVVEAVPHLLAALMAPPVVDVVAMEVLVADVVVAVPQLQVDLMELPEVDLRVDLEEAPLPPVDLMAPLLLEVAEALEALEAVTRPGMAMLEELPRPVDLTVLQVAEEDQEALVAALLLLAAIMAPLAAVTSLDMELAEVAGEGLAAGTASSSSGIPEEASPHPLTGRMSATSLAGPPSLTGSKTRTSQQPTR